MPGVVPPAKSTDPDTDQATVERSEMLLRAKNIKEFKSVLTCAGLLTFPNGVAIESGINVEFKNKGLFDGKWILQKETLHISENKFVTEIEFRKCMDPVTSKIINTVQNNPADEKQDPDVPKT